MPNNQPPASVTRAAICLWLSAALTLLVTIAHAAGWIEPVDAGGGVALVIGLVTAALLALTAMKIREGRSWARWLFLSVYVLGILSSAVLLAITAELFRSLPTILQANTVVQFVLQAAALVLMFTGSTNRWLKSRTVAAAT